MKLIESLDRRPFGRQGQKVRWGLFECEQCGEKVERRINNGKTQRTCGCNQHPTKHGKYGTPLYRRWSSMIQRCTNEKAASYDRYGGRGIMVCEGWKNFEVFERWALANGYQRHLKLDRKDNDGNYEPDNCRFITQRNNVLNSTSTKLTQELAEKIREHKRLTGESYEKTAAVFNISDRTVFDVVKGVRWQHEQRA